MWPGGPGDKRLQCHSMIWKTGWKKVTERCPGESRAKVLVNYYMYIVHISISKQFEHTICEARPLIVSRRGGPSLILLSILKTLLILTSCKDQQIAIEPPVETLDNKTTTVLLWQCTIFGGAYEIQHYIEPLQVVLLFLVLDSSKDHVDGP